MKFRVLLAALLLPAAALPASELADAIGDRPATAILRTMPSHTPPNHRLKGLTFLAGYEVIGEPVPVPADRSAALVAQLKKPDATKAPLNEEKMRPGAAYRFGEGPDAVNVLVCFSCDKVAVVLPGQDAIAHTLPISQPTRDALLDLAKVLLPKDEAIQELPRVRNPYPVPPPAAPVPADAPRPGGPAAPATE